MPYSKRLLLIFGAGALLGLVVVSANLSWLDVIASGLMAAALLCLPAALIGDWWRYRPWNDIKPAAKGKSVKKRAPRGPASKPARGRKNERRS